MGGGGGGGGGQEVIERPMGVAARRFVPWGGGGGGGGGGGQKAGWGSLSSERSAVFKLNDLDRNAPSFVQVGDGAGMKRLSEDDRLSVSEDS